LPAIVAHAILNSRKRLKTQNKPLLGSNLEETVDA